ncbi:MAG: hypothetical protein IJ852_05370 [Alphaproteobacteria bacterium]|nr:hypothetical protein [Alphaproteobacteria bacterium]
MSKRDDFTKIGVKEIYRGPLNNDPRKGNKVTVIAEGYTTNVEFNVEFNKYGHTNGNLPKNKGNDGR